MDGLWKALDSCTKAGGNALMPETDAKDWHLYELGVSKKAGRRAKIHLLCRLARSRRKDQCIQMREKVSMEVFWLQRRVGVGNDYHSIRQ